MIQIPTHPGAYALLLFLKEPLQLRVGCLRSAFFPSGEYIYLGSACGPGGLRARLGRHLAGKIARPHWHIDYLRPVAKVRAYCYLEIELASVNHMPLECLWSQALLKLPYARAPVSGFGSSDCRSGCRAHLVAFAEGAPLLGTKSLQEALSHAAGKSMNDLVCATIG